MTEWNPNDPYDLGIWDELGESPPASESYQEPFCPENTKVRWAVKNFGEWQTAYNLRHPEKVCPAGILLSDDSKELSWWPQKYAVSTRKTNGDKYPRNGLFVVVWVAAAHERAKAASVQLV